MVFLPRPQYLPSAATAGRWNRFDLARQQQRASHFAVSTTTGKAWDALLRQTIQLSPQPFLSRSSANGWYCCCCRLRALSNHCRGPRPPKCRRPVVSATRAFQISRHLQQHSALRLGASEARARGPEIGRESAKPRGRGPGLAASSWRCCRPSRRLLSPCGSHGTSVKLPSSLLQKAALLFHQVSKCGCFLEPLSRCHEDWSPAPRGACPEGEGGLARDVAASATATVRRQQRLQTQTLVVGDSLTPSPSSCSSSVRGHSSPDLAMPLLHRQP